MRPPRRSRTRVRSRPAPSFELAAVTAVTPAWPVAGVAGRAPGSLGGGAVRLEDGRELGYDYLVVALGAPAPPPPPAVAAALPFQDSADVARLRAALDTARASRAGPPRCCVVGGGPGGVELAATLADPRCGGVAVTLVAASGVLPAASAAQRAAATSALAAAGVTVVTDARVASIARGAEGAPLSVALEGREAVLEAEVAVWAAGLGAGDAPSPLDALGLEAGRLVVDDTLRARGHECVFALGDCAAVEGPPLPATAQVAFQAADYAAFNVWATHARRPRLPFRYQHLGDMLALGGPQAASLALPGGLAALDGPAAALLRRAAYVYRQPTLQQAAVVGAAWMRAVADAVSR